MALATTQLYLVTRSLPQGGKRWQRPGYLAIVAGPVGWDSTRPLIPATMARDGVRVIWSQVFADARYSGPRSDHGRALAHARAIMADPSLLSADP